jgi:hypothetical protein
VEDSGRTLTISAVYLPLKHAIKQEQLEEFYNSPGLRIITGEDYNAKHTNWGSRLISPRGREVLKTMEKKKTTLNIYPRQNPLTGHLTGANYQI